MKQIRILSRVVSYCEATGNKPEAILYEADERHADLLCQACGLKDNSKSR